MEADGSRIGRITPQGNITEFPLAKAGSMMPRVGGQGPITKGPDGNLWFVEYTGNAIGRITPTAF
jgi:virginiamycin B lyase